MRLFLFIFRIRQAAGKNMARIEDLVYIFLRRKRAWLGTYLEYIKLL
jgi:hypothetical protein